MNRIILSLYYLLIGSTVLAQSPILEKYVQLGLEENLALKQRTFDVQKSLAALSEAEGFFMPQVSFIANYTLAGGGRRIDFPIGDLLNPVYNTLNVLTDWQQFPNVSNVNEQFLPNNFHETKFRVIQPLFNSDIYFGYRAKQALIPIQEAQKKVYAEELSKNIKIAYLQYLQSNQLLEIYQSTEVLLREVLRVNQKLVKNDLATSEIIYAAEYEIQKVLQERATAQQNLQSSQAYFNFLLNRNLNESIEIDSSITQQIISNQELSSLEETALQNRTELTQLKNAQFANEQLLKMNEYRKYPTLNLVGDVGFQGLGYTFDSNQDFWLMQVSLQWDLFKGRQNKHKIQQTRIEQDKLSTQFTELQSQIRLQVQQAFFALQASQEAINANLAGLKSAEKSFQLTKRKYEEGQARFVELMDARTKFTNAQFALVLSQYNYLIKQVELERATAP